MLQGIDSEEYSPLIERVLEQMDWVMPAALRLAAEHDRTGGYYCLADKVTGAPLLIAAFGTIPTDEAAKYLRLSQEKPWRLAQNPDHILSWQSRDPKVGKWGGAVRWQDALSSFSGFPEGLDEAINLILGIRTDQLVGGASDAMALISNNQFYGRLYTLLPWH